MHNSLPCEDGSNMFWDLSLFVYTTPEYFDRLISVLRFVCSIPAVGHSSLPLLFRLLSFPLVLPPSELLWFTPLDLFRPFWVFSFSLNVYLEFIILFQNSGTKTRRIWRLHFVCLQQRLYLCHDVFDSKGKSILWQTNLLCWDFCIHTHGKAVNWQKIYQFWQAFFQVPPTCISEMP